MAEIYRVIISRDASDDLQHIFDWIAKDSVDIAAKVVQKLLDEIDSLQESPQRYAVIETLRPMPFAVRRLVARPYRILYWVEERQQAVRILAVRHGRQRPWPR
jgi:plasmid stabilization system protein ParE